VAEVTYLEAIRAAMADAMREDERVFLIGEDVGQFGGPFGVSKGLLDEFGADRIIDAPIAEEGFVGAAFGAAWMGERPIAELQFADFISCAFDPIVTVGAKTHWRSGIKLPVVIRSPFGGGVRGGPFHASCPEGFFVGTAGLKVVCPASVEDAYGLLRSAIEDDDPVLYFEHKALYRRLRAEAPQASVRTPIGRARIARPGSDLTLVAYGAMVDVGLAAAGALADEASVEVLDLRTVWPLDSEAILVSLARTSRLCVLQEASAATGAAGEVLSLVAREGFELLDAPPLLIAAPNAPVPFAPELEDAYIPSLERVVGELRRLGAY
jgi:2-oxoisovalerate dehydrogenase E1 component beta subunit